MKKFIAIMVMLLIGLVANAQITVNEKGNGYEFHLGEYVFEEDFASTIHNIRFGLDGFNHRVLYCKTKDREEAMLLDVFIKSNVNAIEEKYGVVLWDPYLTRFESESCRVVISGNEVRIDICTKDYFDKKTAEIRDAKARAETEKYERLKSLNDIL